MAIHLNGDVTTLFRNSTTTTPDAPTKKPATKPERKTPNPPPAPDRPMPATPSPGHEPDYDPGGPNRCPGPCTVPP